MRNEERRAMTTETAIISVENLSKRYRIGAREKKHDTLIGAAAAWLTSPISNFRRLSRLTSFNEDISQIPGSLPPDHSVTTNGKKQRTRNEKRGAKDEEQDILWALKDVTFNVKKGEILGVIGRNGAGKSTLLKILSRITAPTSGRVVIEGRVASLLEVGTGFHPELTGRENIYLNGTILGMTKHEVDRKFDEIVDFAEIQKFIDTPVKRYSSGMYVRLAFAVAAHLEPEILIVDEVLAVGDAVFQKKCLGKMESVAGYGRTILFVSHNMQAVQSLCSRCLLLDGGRIATSGEPEKVINAYLRGDDSRADVNWEDPVGLGNEDLRLKRLSVFSPNGARGTDAFLSKNDICVELTVWVKKRMSGLCVGFDLLRERGETVFRTYDSDGPDGQFQPLQPGGNLLRCAIPRGLLNAGKYFVAPRIGIHNQKWIVTADPVVSFSVTLTHGESAFWNVLYEGNRPGVIAPILSWKRQ